MDDTEADLERRLAQADDELLNSPQFAGVPESRAVKDLAGDEATRQVFDRIGATPETTLAEARQLAKDRVARLNCSQKHALSDEVKARIKSEARRLISEQPIDIAPRKKVPEEPTLGFGRVLGWIVPLVVILFFVAMFGFGRVLGWIVSLLVWIAGLVGIVYILGLWSLWLNTIMGLLAILGILALLGGLWLKRIPARVAQIGGALQRLQRPSDVVPSSSPPDIVPSECRESPRQPDRERTPRFTKSNVLMATLGLAALAAAIAGGYWLYDRIRYGPCVETYLDWTARTHEVPKEIIRPHIEAKLREACRKNEPLTLKRPITITPGRPWRGR